MTLSLLPSSQRVLEIVTSIHAAIVAGGRVYACGNGGSCCDAMHLVEELVARYDMERPGIPAHHFGDAGTITCWANDYSFSEVYARQVETLMTKRDILVIFSTSGNSKNVLLALEAANKLGAMTVAFLGKGGGQAKNLATQCFVVESDITSYVQEAHITLIHIICSCLEEMLFSQP